MVDYKARANYKARAFESFSYSESLSTRISLLSFRQADKFGGSHNIQGVTFY